MNNWKNSLPETDIKISLDDEPPEAWDRAYNAGKPKEWKEEKVAYEIFDGDTLIKMAWRISINLSGLQIN